MASPAEDFTRLMVCMNTDSLGVIHLRVPLSVVARGRGQRECRALGLRRLDAQLAAGRPVHVA